MKQLPGLALMRRMLRFLIEASYFLLFYIPNQRSSDARVTHSHARSYYSSGPLVSLLPFMVRGHMCLGFCSRFTDCLFVARFVDRAAAWLPSSNNFARK